MVNIYNLRRLRHTEIEEFQEMVLHYYQEHGRDFPWRETENDLHALTAEIMLQQTSYYQVEPVYDKFCERYSVPGGVLEAEEDEIRQLFSSLGLHNRTEYIVSAAEFLASGSEINQEDLLEVKGIGRYTANAFLSLHKGRRYPIVDGNVVRVFEKHFDIEDDSPPSTNEEIWCLAWELLPEKNFREHNLGLIDYGAELYGKNPD